MPSDLKSDFQAMYDQYFYGNDAFAVICEVSYQGPFKNNHMKGRFKDTVRNLQGYRF